ncbi:MAG: hypothetical protein KF726_07090 [Anaerolineae bacterium]|nr:hypothetical protein [Anaerolineae bacterium]
MTDRTTLVQLSLDGEDWLLKEFYGEDWRWRNSHLPNSRDGRGWRAATVPGSIYDDLQRNGEIPDPHFEMNTRLLEWIPARTWIFKRNFSVGTDFRGKYCWLRFEGIDYEAEFFLNGVTLGTHRGMYTPAEFEVSTHLNYEGDNLLVVVISHAPDEMPQVGRTSRTRTHKSRMGYWWDFCPRFVQIGIWDSVTLYATGKAWIIDVWVQPQLNTDFSRATINATIELAASTAIDVGVECRLLFGGEVISTQQQVSSANDKPLKLSFELDQPQLWYPNGYGAQPLYTLDVQISANAELSDSRQVNFGIRKIEFAPNDNAAVDAYPYVLTINGHKVFIKGWNWVPQDAMYGLPQLDKLDRLLTLAQHAHVNMLRVWGGGLIEKEAFYARCDQLGILVWQEFIFSSAGIENLPPSDLTFIDMLTDEAAQIVRRKRNHPSLALWCGGNELQYDEEKPIDGNPPLIAALHAVIRQHDPDRVFLPSSPTGGVFSFSIENAERDPDSLHDVHGPWEHQGLTKHYTLYNTVRCLLHSEFGVEGLTNLRTLEHTISAANRFPVTLDNPVWHHLGAWWVKERQWRESLGEVANLESLVRATQLLQADGVRYAIEAHRRDMYHNSGALPWQFNEPYPMAACTSAVDYYSQPKPLYYAVARAYASLQISAQFATQSWLNRDQFEAELWVSNTASTIYESATIEARLYNLSGEVIASQLTSLVIGANRSAKIITFQASLQGVDQLFLLDLKLWTDAHQSESIARNQYLFTCTADLSPLLALTKTTLLISRQADVLTIRNIGKHIAILVWIEDKRELESAGCVYFSDNYFSLVPGETRRVRAQWVEVATTERQLSIRAWNSNEIIVTG